MKLFAIGDLHLNGKADKPMDVFGSNWDRHREKIFDAWQSLVSPSDCVLVPGDICWAMYLEDAVDDLNSIAELNGTKILIRGNHDYWWASPTRIRAVCPAVCILFRMIRLIWVRFRYAVHAVGCFLRLPTSEKPTKRFSTAN